MSKDYIQPGCVIDYTPTSAVLSGAGIVMGTLFGIALADIEANASGAVQIEGVFQLAKLSTDDMAQGQAVYWDNTNDRMTLTSAGNTLAGKVIAAAGVGTTTCKVKLNV